MKYLLVPLFFLACNDSINTGSNSSKEIEFKKYYIEVDRKELNLTGSGFQNSIRYDSSYAHNDSAAYIEGAKSYKSLKKVHEVLTEKGASISAPPTEFRVFNGEGENIEYNLSPDFIARAKVYANDWQKKTSDALLDSISFMGLSYRQSKKKND